MPDGLALPFCGFAIHMSLEIERRLEHQDPALLNRYLDPCFGIASDALALAAHDEGTKAGELHVSPQPEYR